MSKNRSKFLFFGVIIGFIAGLFLAPKKGSELRKDAKDKFDEVKENPKDVLHETFNDVKERITTLIDDSSEFDDIKISEEEIVISKSFDDEGEVK
ncbi:YtxH domain-containing protein [Romboutsia weinsteinii]|uniref:YtxH domain-containing protein n=1 Tax=Romboutsia weinsteinii TaxID=2020949 RepID=A0A371IYM4_9FIRM|nr:YtxH domain-containing protein [Romboutsia weinsteinii]RDY25591.1 YtxH domain-containing protein [Romboutsia weinsteinii]